MNLTSKIYVAGHRGLLGSALVRLLVQRGYQNLVLRSRHELDLLDTQKTRSFFELEKPEYVFADHEPRMVLSQSIRAQCNFKLHVTLTDQATMPPSIL